MEIFADLRKNLRTSPTLLRRRYFLLKADHIELCVVIYLILLTPFKLLLCPTFPTTFGGWASLTRVQPMQSTPRQSEYSIWQPPIFSYFAVGTTKKWKRKLHSISVMFLFARATNIRFDFNQKEQKQTDNPHQGCPTNYLSASVSVQSFLLNCPGGHFYKFLTWCTPS